jgi:hypothetical protein
MWIQFIYIEYIDCNDLFKYYGLERQIKKNHITREQGGRTI